MMKNIISLIYGFLLIACVQSEISIKASEIKTLDELPGNCPYLTKDNHGNTVVSWVRMTSDSTSIFCFARSTDDSHSFNKTTIIPSSTNIYAHSENLPKIIFKPNGDVIAIWGAKNPTAANKYGGLVYYAQSFDEGKTWTAAKQLVTDTAGYDQRYADIALLPNGEVAIIWLDNRSSKNITGSALYFASTNARNGFANESLISESACQCCRTSLFTDGKGNIHALYRGIINDSIRDMVHLVSTNGGKIFSKPSRIHNDNWVLNGCPHTGPAMTENKNGIHFAWYTGGRKRGSFFTSSVDNGNTFNNYDSITSQGSHPQLSVLSSQDVLVVWDETVKYAGDFNKRIGIQVRDENGKFIAGKILTTDSLYSEYPVVRGIGNNAALVAYATKKSGKNYIAYQRVVIL